MQRVRKLECARLKDWSTIFFVPSVFTEEPTNHVNFATLTQEFHPDGRPVSVCSMYLRWLYGPGARVDDFERHMQIWKNGTELYFFRSTGEKCQSAVVETQDKIQWLWTTFDTFGSIVVSSFEFLQELDALMDSTQILVFRRGDIGKSDLVQVLDPYLERHPKLRIKFECVLFSPKDYGTLKHKNRVQINRAEFSDREPSVSAARQILSKLSDDVREVVNVQYG